VSDKTPASEILADNDQPTSPLQRIGGIALRVFVVFHIIAITVWALPTPPKQYEQGTAHFGLRTDGVVPFLQSARDIASDGTLYYNYKFLKPSPIKFYSLATGFWQYWDMFAPNPSSIDQWGDAEITYKDGTVQRYQYPRMYLLSIPLKYVKERYRKFYERAGGDDCSYMWPQFAQRIAYLNNKDPNNPPKTVKLFRHTLPTAAPGEHQLDKYQETQYFTWSVDLDALKTGRPVP
jgi:hypothetical protein